MTNRGLCQKGAGRYHPAPAVSQAPRGGAPTSHARPWKSFRAALGRGAGGQLTAGARKKAARNPGSSGTPCSRSYNCVSRAPCASPATISLPAAADHEDPIHLSLSLARPAGLLDLLGGPPPAYPLSLASISAPPMSSPLSGRGGPSARYASAAGENWIGIAPFRRCSCIGPPLSRISTYLLRKMELSRRGGRRRSSAGAGWRWGTGSGDGFVGGGV